METSQYYFLDKAKVAISFHKTKPIKTLSRDTRNYKMVWKWLDFWKAHTHQVKILHNTQIV